MTTKQMSTAEIKDCAKNILEKFAEFCECNDLKYYLAYGTLIGAVRHKGYIPWDDDIDLEMPRKDYNKLMEILAKQKNLITQNIEIKTPYSDNYQYPFIKVIDNTTFVQETSMRKKYTTSIWIDIFPLDNIPDDEKEQKKFIEKLYKMNKYYFYTIERKYTQKNILGKLRFYFVLLLFLLLFEYCFSLLICYCFAFVSRRWSCPRCGSSPCPRDLPRALSLTLTGSCRDRASRGRTPRARGCPQTAPRRRTHIQ